MHLYIYICIHSWNFSIQLNIHSNSSDSSKLFSLMNRPAECVCSHRSIFVFLSIAQYMYVNIMAGDGHGEWYMILYIYIYIYIICYGPGEWERYVQIIAKWREREIEMGNDKNFPVFVQFLHPTARPLLGGSWRCNSTTKAAMWP